MTFLVIKAAFWLFLLFLGLVRSFGAFWVAYGHLSKFSIWWEIWVFWAMFGTLDELGAFWASFGHLRQFGGILSISKISTEVLWTSVFWNCHRIQAKVDQKLTAGGFLVGDAAPPGVVGVFPPREQVGVSGRRHRPGGKGSTQLLSPHCQPAQTKTRQGGD